MPKEFQLTEDERAGELTVDLIEDYLRRTEGKAVLEPKDSGAQFYLGPSAVTNMIKETEKIQEYKASNKLN